MCSCGAIDLTFVNHPQSELRSLNAQLGDEIGALKKEKSRLQSQLVDTTG